jgi:hypothetical protein
MHVQFQQFNPFRDPQWRYERCLKLVEHQPQPLPASPRRDDEYVRRYRKFLLRFLRSDDEEARAALFPLDPPLFYAHLIHHHPDREWRTIVQARLLTGDDDAEIANYGGTLPDTIHLYEQLFFNVRDRLDNKDWIVKTVLGTATQRASNRYDTMTDHQRDSLYKLFGYFGGPIILNTVISGFASRDLPTQSKHVPGWFDRTMKNLIKRKATMEAHRFEVDKFKVMELMHIHLAIITAEKEGGGGGNIDYDKAVEAMLQHTPWGLAKKGYSHLNPLQQKYAISHVEPRADEQLELALGKVPASLIERETHTGKTLAAMNLTLPGE